MPDLSDDDLKKISTRLDSMGWKESDHPRAEDGKFGSGGGGGRSSSTETKKTPTQKSEATPQSSKQTARAAIWAQKDVGSLAASAGLRAQKHSREADAAHSRTGGRTRRPASEEGMTDYLGPDEKAQNAHENAAHHYSQAQAHFKAGRVAEGHAAIKKGDASEDEAAKYKR